MIIQGTTNLKYQSLWGYKNSVSQGQWENVIFANHTHSLEINLYADAGGNSTASGFWIFNTNFGASVTTEVSTGHYGPGTQRITNIEMRYLNTGGSQSYIIQVYLTDGNSTGESANLSWSIKGFSQGTINNIS